MPLKPAPPPSTPCASSLPLLLFEIYDTINFVKHLKLQSSRIPQRSLLYPLSLSLSPHSLSLSLSLPVAESDAERAFNAGTFCLPPRLLFFFV